MNVMESIIAAVIKPRNFAGLMDMYEQNYRLIGRLVPELAQLSGCYQSQVDATPPLELCIIEHTKFTATISLTYHFESPLQAAADPSVHIRLYHDARLAEALSSNPEPSFMRNAYWQGQRSELDRRWQLNLFVHRWLEYSLSQGHHFPPAHQWLDATDAVESI